MLTIEEIGRLIDEDETSERKRLARVGQRYYEGDHDIKGYKIYFYDADGVLKEDKTRSNIKIPHPFFTELVDQCVQHVLSGDDPIVVPEDDTDKQLAAELEAYFGDEFEAELAETITDTCACGFGYLYGYVGEDARTVFQSAEALGVREVRAKDVQANADHVIYWYVDRIDKGRKTITRIQVHDEKEISYYVRTDNGRIALDEDAELNPRPQVVFTDVDGNKYGKGLGYVPFFLLKANRKQHSHLKPVKALIDDYDLMSCGLSNNVQDVNEAVWVVKGFDGKLDEMITNIKAKKHIGVPEGGDVDIRTIDIPYEAREKKLDIDEKNIYRFGMGLNTSGLKDVNATTNMAIKAAYALLDLKCSKMEKYLTAMMRKLVRIALDEINQRHNKSYGMSDVKIQFTRQTITNEQDNAQIELTKAQTDHVRVSMLLDVAAQCGIEGVLEALCALLDLDYAKVKELIEEPADGGLKEAEKALTGDE